MKHYLYYRMAEIEGKIGNVDSSISMILRCFPKRVLLTELLNQDDCLDYLLMKSVEAVTTRELYLMKGGHV